MNQTKTQAHTANRGSPRPVAPPSPHPGGSDPLTAAEQSLSRWLWLFIGLWCLAGAVSVLLHWAVEPKTQARGESPFSDELKIIAEMAATHGAVLRAVEERSFDTPKSLAELDRELTEHKRKLRELSLVSVQDPWSREPLVKLRQRLIESYFLVQDVLERMQLVPEGDPERQRLLESLGGPLEAGRGAIDKTTRELKIRPGEVRLEADTLKRIYGLAENAGQR